METILIAAVSLAVGIVIGFLLQKRNSQQPRGSITISEVGTPMAVSTLPKHLYRIGSDTTAGGQVFYYIVAYETAPATGIPTTKRMGKYATFTEDEIVSIQLGSNGIEFVAQQGKTGYRDLEVVFPIQTFGPNTTVVTENGVMKLTDNGNMTPIEIGRIITFKKDNTGIVVGYVDQNDIGIIS